MKIIVVYDNKLYSVLPGLKSDWGFSALISIDDKHILFDTGANGNILIRNMTILGIDPLIVTDIFISHNHYDHVGGLSHFLNINNNVILHSPPSFRAVKNVNEIRYYDKPEKLYDNIFTSGELDNIEQSLAIETGKGLKVITGCSHPGMKDIFNSFSSFGEIKSIIGGFHNLSDFSVFSNLELISPMHCTKHVGKIKEMYPNQYRIGGVGRTFTL